MATGPQLAQVNAILARQRAKDQANFAGTKVNPLPTSDAFQLSATTPVGGRPNNLLANTLAAISQTKGSTAPGLGTDMPAMDPAVANQVMKLQDVRTNLNEQPHHGMSLLGHVFDILSKPLNATAGAVYGGIKSAENGKGGILDAVGRGLEGAAKGAGEGITGSGQYAHKDWGDVLRASGVHNGVLDTIGGIGGDVVLDPLNLVGVGEVAKVADAIKGGSHLLEGVNGLDKGAKDIALGHNLIDQVAATRQPLDRSIIEAARQQAKPHWNAAANEKFLQNPEAAGFTSDAAAHAAKNDYIAQLEQAFNHNVENANASVTKHIGVRTPVGSKVIAPKPDVLAKIGEAVKNAALPTEKVAPHLGDAIPATERDILAHSAENAGKTVESNGTAARLLSRLVRPSEAFRDKAYRDALIQGIGQRSDLWGAISKELHDKFGALPEHESQALLQDFKVDPKSISHPANAYPTKEGVNAAGIFQDHLYHLYHDVLRPNFVGKGNRVKGNVAILNKHLVKAGLDPIAPQGLRNYSTFLTEIAGAADKSDNIVDFTSRLTHASAQATLEHNMMWDLAARHGEALNYTKPKKKGDAPPSANLTATNQRHIGEKWRAVNHPAFQDEFGNPTHIFHPEIADRLDALGHMLGNPTGRSVIGPATKGKPELQSLLKQYDRSLNSYKKALTVVNPGSHSRYMLGSVIQAHINGFSNPRNWIRGAKVALDKDPAIRNQSLSQVMGKEFDNYLSQGANREGRVVYNSSNLGRPVRSGELWREMMNRGILHNFTHSQFVKTGEDVAKDHGIATKLNDKITSFGEKRDNVPRMAMFIDALERAPKGLSEQKKFDWAADQTIKTFHNFTDMSRWEKNVGQRLIPFYADIRKNTPMVLKAMFNNPGRVAGYPLSLQEISQGTGGQHDWSTDPYFHDIVPQYLFDYGAVPVGANGSNPVMLNQKNHVADVLFQLAGSHSLSGEPSWIGRQLLSTASPFIRIPAELAMKRQAYTGNPITKQSDYLMQQVPMADMIRKIVENTGANQAPTGASGLRTGLDAAANNLLGVGLTEDTPRQQLSAVLSRLKPEQQKLRKQQPGFKAP